MPYGAPGPATQAAARELAMTGVLNLRDAGLQPVLGRFIHERSAPRSVGPRALEVAALMCFDCTSPSGLVIPLVAEASWSYGCRWSDLYRKQLSV